MFNNCFFLNRAIYEIVRKNIVEQGKATFMRIACSISKATNPHSEYVLPIAFT